ncbi:hypothetical protein [Streptomyces sp. NPDC005507]|uniref:hypothetical protein n=1 Tax=Streptomyces sp. NPDC005507 TaxID=3154885 RepID=UPI0033B6F3CE
MSQIVGATTAGGGPGGDALHSPCDHQWQDTVGRPEDRRTGRRHQKCGEQRRTALQAVARGIEGQLRTEQAP